MSAVEIESPLPGGLRSGRTERPQPALPTAIGERTAVVTAPTDDGTDSAVAVRDRA